MNIKCFRTLTLLATTLVALSWFVEPAAAQTPQPSATPGTLQNETRARFEPTNEGFDHIRRDVMIPMRDGVKLHTVILVTKGINAALARLTVTRKLASITLAIWKRGERFDAERAVQRAA